LLTLSLTNEYSCTG